MAALQYVDVPGYAALLLRRTYRDLSLPGALMDRAESWLRPTDARWDHETHSWRFPAGSTLTFGYLQYEGDKYTYQSAEFQFIGADELTQFSESQYTFMFSRLRRPTCPNHPPGVPEDKDCPNCQRIADLSRVPLRMRWASNPGGAGHEWVKQRMLVEGPSAGRPFVPASLADNPHIDRESYVRSLSHLDPITRAQLLAGDWTVRAEGKKFRREWFAEKIVARAPRCSWVRFWDLAATEPKRGRRGKSTDPDYTAGALMGRDELDRYFLAGMVRRRETPGEVERIIKTTAAADTKDIRVRMEQEPGASGKTVISHYRRRVLAGYDFKGIPASGAPELRVNPISSLAEAGDLYLVEGPWIGAFIDEAESYPGGAHDDQVIATAGAYADLAGATGLALPEGSIPSREDREDVRTGAEPSSSGIMRREF